ncbi:hypothetical protein, partial [Pseudomonas sp. NPDC089406]|uniref:hypothetical protein n=2 Tax=Pseudomonas sp. NPDC089406 TaxID=3364463 RepID=UPI00384AEAB1
MNAPPTPFTLGRQHFDGLGRQLTVECGGRTTESHHIANQLPVSHNILADRQRVGFSYIPELDHLVRQITPANEPAQTFDYDPRLALISSASGQLGQQRTSYTAAGKPRNDTWSIAGHNHVTTWQYSLTGLLLGFTDAATAEHHYHYDAFGRVHQLQAGSVTCDFTYDDFARPLRSTTRDTRSGNQLTQSLTYDSLGREHTRTFETTGNSTSRQVQTLTYTDLDQLASRHWQRGATQGSEHFSYDLHGRLVLYTADSAVAPEDPFGNRVVRQQFTLNRYDGHTQITSLF